MVDHKICLSKFKRMETRVDHNSIKLEIKSRKLSGESLDIWKLNYILLNNCRTKKKSERNLENMLNWMRMKVKIEQNVWDDAKVVLTNDSQTFHLMTPLYSQKLLTIIAGFCLCAL